MIYLLGVSGYIGSAYKSYLEGRLIAFRGLSRSELDYADLATLTAALRADKPEFLINAAGSPESPMWMPVRFTRRSAWR
jgi:dTDP-4-dehydrorhamnose reductase